MANTTKEKLVEAGYELFSRNGFHGVGLDRVLDAAGVSKQTFYNHFESRDDLAVAVLKMRHQAELEDYARALQQVAGDDPRKRLYAFFELLDSWMNQPDFQGCIFLTATVEFPSQFDPVHQAAAEYVFAVRNNLKNLAEAAGAEDPQALAEELMLLVEGAVLLRHSVGQTGAARTAGRIAAQLLKKHLREGPESSVERGLLVASA